MGSIRCGRTTPAFRLPLLACLALLSSLALDGCAARYLPPSAPIQDKVDCLATMSGWSDPEASAPPSDIKGSVPEGFVPVDVITCSQDYGEAGGLPKLLVKQQHLMGDYTALLAALAQPSDHGGNWPCTADMEIVPALWLVNAAGEAVNASWPVDGCGKTSGKPATSKALAELGRGHLEVLEVPGTGPAPERMPTPAPTLPLWPATSLPPGMAP